jgi:hypothetical protein
MPNRANRVGYPLIRKLQKNAFARDPAAMI